LNNEFNKEEVWIETYEEIFPDFIACDLGNEVHHRPPLKKYIKMTEDFDKLKNLYEKTKGSLWNAYAKTQFYGKINTFLFSNVAAFNVYHNGKRIITEQFRSNWEEHIINLIENKKTNKI